MDTLSAFESYVSAVQAGSLSGAARQRKISQPAVSQQILALEAFYDTRLLYRSRSGVRMTESGELVYKRAIIILDEQENLRSELETLSGKVAGKLTVTATLGLSQHVMGDVIIQLTKQYPELKVLLRADDRILNLDSENIDIAIRFGALGNGSGIARKIATLDMLYVAAPKYLDSVGRPTKPEQLISLDFIQYKANDDEIVTTLSRGSQSIQVPIKIGLTAQLPDLIFQALQSNLGYARAPRFLVDKAIAKGQLEVVLPKWEISATELFLVYLARETLSPRVLAFLNVLFTRLEKTQGINLVPSAKQVFMP